MRIYRHYKNKLYKYLLEAKHSETLEDVVIYDCLYDNPASKTWVRPKENFFSTVEVGGRDVPRFEEVQVTIEPSLELTTKHLEEVSEIAKVTLTNWSEDRFAARLKEQHGWHLLLAYFDKQPVGFKLGFELDPSCFYSWVGGVRPEYRGFGVASRLMTSQHEWCRTRGYLRIQTKTQNKYRQMLRLNLKYGFEIKALDDAKSIEQKIILEKTL